MTRQQVHLLRRLKQADRLREFIAQELSGPGKQELLSALEEAKKEAVAVHEKAEKGARLLQEKEFNVDTLKSTLSRLTSEHDNLKADNVRMQAEYDQLALSKVDADGEIARLKAALEKSQKALIEAAERSKTAKKDLEDNFCQQADEAFYFGYCCCMRKNNILDDVPTIPSDMEKEEEEEEAALDETVKEVGRVEEQVVEAPAYEVAEKPRSAIEEVATPIPMEEDPAGKGNGVSVEQAIDIENV